MAAGEEGAVGNMSSSESKCVGVMRTPYGRDVTDAEAGAGS